MSRHQWMPVSPCGPRCLTGTEAVVGPVRAAVRLGWACCVVLAGLLVAPLLVVLPGGPRTRLVRGVFRAVLRAFGVRLVVRGALDVTPGRGALVVTNHVSWLDVVAANAIRPMRALAKREIASWPVIGRLTTAAGTVYLDRERLRSLPGTVAELAAALRGGALVGACPEGTTWCGAGLGAFTPAVFQAALDAGVPVRPIAVRFLADGRETPAAAFIGDETLLDSVRRVARLRGLVLDVVVLPEIAPGTADTRAGLAALAHAAVGSALGHVRLPAPAVVTAVRAGTAPLAAKVGR